MARRSDEDKPRQVQTEASSNNRPGSVARERALPVLQFLNIGFARSQPADFTAQLDCEVVDFCPSCKLPFAAHGGPHENWLDLVYYLARNYLEAADWQTLAAWLAEDLAADEFVDEDA
jgi:hypothetical protein